MNNDVLLLGFPDYQQQAHDLAKATDIAYADVKIHYFPDGESQLLLPEHLPAHIVLCRSLSDPNEKLIELIMAAASARQQGVKTITLVAPYLCYMRQDKAFHLGEVVSQTIIGDLLAHYVDNVLTVDAHLHRVHDLSQAIPAKKAINVTATNPMAYFLQAHIDKPFLIGPDGESEQWVSDIATHYKMDYAIATKERLGDKKVAISLPSGHYQGRNIVLVDDVASTGKTLLAVAKQLAKYQPASLSILVTHALFVDNALAELHAANVTNIWSCDTIPHVTNSIILAEFLAETLRTLITP